jgi:hypothetical protein
MAGSPQRGLEETGDRPGQREGGGGDAAPDQCIERDRPRTLTSSRGPAVFSAMGVAPLAHRMVTAAKRTGLDFWLQELPVSTRDSPSTPGHWFRIPRSMPPVMLLTTDRSNFIR